MGIKYTPQQENAINTRGCDILVAAAAGSGKTAVLVERIIKMVTDENNPVNIDSLLVVTYTEAAASEMRERISDAIEKKINEISDESSPAAKHLIKQLSLLNKASITTIHSFCLSVVRRNFNIIGIDPNFRIADTAELELIKSEIIDELFENLYAEENNSDFIKLVESYAGNKDDKKLSDLVLNIYDFIQSTPSPSKWLDESLKKFDINENKNIYNPELINILRQDFSNKLNYAKQNALRCLNIIEKEHALAVKISKNLQDTIALADKYLDLIQNNISEAEKKLSEKIKFASMSVGKTDTLSDEAKKEIQAIQKDEIKPSFDYITEKITHFSEDMIKHQMNGLYPVLKTLVYVIKEFSIKYSEAKQEKLIVDFSDLEHFCLKILHDENNLPSKTAKEFQEKFKEIIIDEYQDSSIIQELILQAVSKKSLGKPNRFMVGDIKQCIYKFRLANPELFTEKYNTYKTELSSQEYRIDLFHNFRSRECVISAINFIFYQLMTPHVGEIKYDESAALYLGANYPPCPKNITISKSAELEIIDISKSNALEEEFEEDIEYDDSEINDMTGIELEAASAANKIKNMLAVQKLNVYDKKLNSYRPAEYRDIVILLRTTKNTADTFLQILTQNGIPSITDTKGGYFQTPEVMTILSFLQIIDNEYQDIPLITALHSPVYSLTGEELAKIKASVPNTSFFNSVLHYISPENEECENDIIYKLHRFKNDLQRWKKLSQESTINELLQYIYDDTNYYNYVGILSGGAVRQANLKALQEKAILFEKTNLKGLFKFIKYIERIKTGGSDFGEAKVLSENENVVRIMSIHKSKGLEFPIVFVCGLGKKFYMPDLKESFVMHQSLGFGPTYQDIEKRLSYNTAARYSISQKIKSETLSEELRILYVAFTRAREKLILTGCLSNTSKILSKCERLMDLSDIEIPSFFISGANSPIEWIISALTRHKNADILHSHEYFHFIKCRELYNDNSNWQINILKREDLIITEKKEAETNKKLYEDLKKLSHDIDYSGNKKEISKRLSWEYPNSIMQALPLTISISEIKRKSYEYDNPEIPNFENQTMSELEIPNFIKKERPMTAAQKGIATHTLMRHIDFQTEYTEETLKKYIAALTDKNILTIQESNSIKINKILNFLNSEIAARIKKSKSVYKECPFVMGLTPYEIYKTNEYKNITDKILVHGIIDLYFEENSNIILLDYKTNYISKGNSEKIKEKYKIQMSLYKKALEQFSGKKVSETILYLFGADTFVKY